MGLRFINLSIVLVGLGVLSGCGSDRSTGDEMHEVFIRMAREPDNLNPTRSQHSAATPIESLIALPLAEYDPYTLELTPLLIKELARIEDVTEGEYTGGQRFYYEMREEARWDDGSPVTGHDYAFTLKAVLNPQVEAAEWRAYLSFIKHVEVDADDPKRFSVTVEEPYMLAEAVTCNFNLLPEYVYDPKGYLREFSVSDLSDEARLEELGEENESLIKFADYFGSVGFNRDTVIGSGPYRLVEWVTNQYIILERKTDWWGDDVENPPTLLQAYPDRIVYNVIPDEAAAIAALKDGSCDFVPGVSANAFVQMRGDTQWQNKFQFMDHPLLQYRYIEVNNRNSILKEKNVRKALAYAIDYDAILNNVELGLGWRTVGPFSPSKDYYNKSLSVVQQNIDTAVAFLNAAGWVDTDGDGTVDKVVEGVRQELEVDILTTQSPAGQQVALIVKEGASKAGIEVNVVTKDAAAWRQAIGKREFELLPMQVRSSPAPNDPYQGWHSESDQPGGGNRSGFRNDKADDLIEEIRIAESSAERNALYLELQELIYEEQPVIFLYIPVERMIVSKSIDMEPSSRRPGYFENLFKRDNG